MSYQDKTIQCKDCGAEFVFTTGEQEFYAEKGFTNEPGRCPACRSARKQRTNNNDRSSRQMFDVICSGCGVETQVPFQPRTDRPVYCRDCFQSQNKNYAY